MNYHKKTILALIIMCCGCIGKMENNRPPYYLSQVVDVPIEFGAGNITTNNGISFSNDGRQLYISKPVEKTFINGKSFTGIYRSDFIDGNWSEPKLIEFSNEIDAYHPVLSTDNETMFFNSRSHPDTIDKSIPHNIWYSQQTKNDWSTPQMIEGINSTSYDSYPSIAKSKNLYFNSDREGGNGGMDIYFSEYLNGGYQKAVNIKAINSSASENDLVVDPDERFIIFNRYIDSTQEIDLYVSYRKDSEWTTPEKLDIINVEGEWELTPTLSPEGKYFFYELNGKIMQIELAKILRLN